MFFDRSALIAAVGEAHPDVIIHQLTDLTAADFAANDRLRVVGTRNLVDAAKAAGVRRMIAQSLAIIYAHKAEPATEQDPLADETPRCATRSRACARSKRRWRNSRRESSFATDLFYGPGTWYSKIGPFADAVRRAERPAGKGVQFVHPCGRCRAGGDARDRLAGGCVQYRRRRTCYRHRMAAAFAAAIGAPAPPMGEFDGYEQGASNRKARQELGWKPLHPTWREGFLTALD